MTFHVDANNDPTNQEYLISGHEGQKPWRVQVMDQSFDNKCKNGESLKTYLRRYERGYFHHHYDERANDRLSFDVNPRRLGGDKIRELRIDP